MKSLFVLIFLVCSNLWAVSQKAIVLPKNQFYLKECPARPGDTLIISDGDYQESAIFKVDGKPGNPITIINRGRVRMGTGASRYGLAIEGSHFQIIGDGQWLFTCTVANQFLGTSIDFRNSSDYTVRGLVIEKTQLGFRSNPAAGNPMRNITIQGNRFSQVGGRSEGGRSEAIYFGNTSPCSLNASFRFEGLRIVDNTFTELMGDAIQVTNAQKALIANNVITGFGSANLDGQMSAIIVGGCSSGEVRGNKVVNGNGAALQFFGSDTLTVTGNTFTNTGQSTLNNQDVIYVNSKSPAGRRIHVAIEGNTIQGGRRFAINNADPSVAIAMGRNFITGVKETANGVAPVKKMVFSITVDGVTYQGFQDGTWLKQ